MRQTLRTITGLFSNMHIRGKLLISYFILIFLPLALMTSITYTNVSRDYEKQILHSADQSFDQAYTFLTYKVNTLIKASDVIYFNADVQTMLTRDKQVFADDYVQQNIDRQELEYFLNSFQNTEDVYRASLYVPGWLMYAGQNFNFMNMDAFSKTENYRALLASKDKVSWLTEHTITNNNSNLDPVPVISLLRKIRNSEQTSEIIGIIELNILQDVIDGIIQKANITNDGVVYIQNSNGAIASCSNLQNFHRINPNLALIKDQDDGLSWNNAKIGSSDYVIKKRTIENTDWTMVTAIPLTEIFTQSTRIRDLMLVLMLVCGLLSYGLAYLITGATVKRILLLKKKMRLVQEGVLNVEVHSTSRDEIGELTDSFNHMIKRIGILVDEQYQNGKEIKNLELKALQAQINPHFLYNTLELINWKAIDNEVPEIAVISQSLAKFYKLSLNKGKDIVSIIDEINHIRAYVQIQNLRFDNKIKLEVRIAPVLHNCNILKLILQPLVENSIIHGILEARDRDEGIITITGFQEKNDIILAVEDDGVGMLPEQAEGLLANGNANDEVQGYGVRNINHRIKLCYGQEYGLTYRSSPGKGTMVEIRIPNR
ncbi:two-component system sensor histidine kinase YesM [Paenibacillus taihuensis]|uniref:Two-component system sensor histidine kinase YesM n=1 Tax=Paenibacillus taihuensis TaxID=1156355 RepID=A0A3D9R3J9_9BACL|nr:sensor histidine kinase [Paenibacillus taihuensis]REE69646.1 two-component system sensor histidine kinase YesM [Paenibacillus taihuensis]